MARVSLRSLYKSFGRTEVVKGIDLEVADGEFVVFVGPSGCGKSTLLRLIAGLEDVTSGSIAIDDTDVTGLEPSRRGVSMVFQSYALYPHMTVYKNSSFGLSLARVPGQTIDQRVRQVARMLQIEPLLDRRPRELSGGQRQRVAIARSIVREPKVFLFDEPLSNLDAALRAQTRIEIARMHQDLKATIIYVTHDQVEAMTLADRMVVLNDGRVEQVGRPADLYRRPANLFVAGFLGSPQMNLLDVAVDGAGNAMAGAERVCVLPRATEGPARLGIRSEDMEIVATGESDGLVGRVELVEELGESRIVYLRLDGGVVLSVRHLPETTPSEGDMVGVRVDASRVHLFDRAGLRIN